MKTNIRYFTIYSPVTDFTGRAGAVSFADGVARVSFDDTRDENGTVVSNEHKVDVGRCAVMFAKRRPGYRVVETDIIGTPLEQLAAEADAAKAEAAAKKAQAKAAADAKSKADAEEAKRKAEAAAKGGAQ